jgi:hypothetical protein
MALLTALPAVAAVCVLAAAPQIDDAGQADPWIGKDGALRETLTLRDSQEGFAGASGTLLTIEPSGAWRESRFLNEKTQPPHREGRLTKEQLGNLLDTLAKLDLPSLPRRLGSAVPVNPHTLTVVAGAHRSAAVLRPGESLSTATAREASGVEAEAWRRFAGIVQAILDATGQDAVAPGSLPAEP